MSTKVVEYRICEYDPCHNLFKHVRSSHSPGYKRYCSTSCGSATSKNIYVCSNPGCGIYFTDHKSRPRKYCSRSCATTVNNKANPKRAIKRECKRCSSSVASGYTYCKECWSHRSTWARDDFVEAWKSGDLSRVQSKSGALRRYARGVIVLLAGTKCSVCVDGTPLTL